MGKGAPEAQNKLPECGAALLYDGQQNSILQKQQLKVLDDKGLIESSYS